MLKIERNLCKVKSNGVFILDPSRNVQTVRMADRWLRRYRQIDRHAER